MAKPVISSNGKAVAKRLDKHMRTLQRNADGIVAHLAVGLAGDLSEATPVDTGASESSWNVTKNTGPVYVDENTVTITSPEAVQARARFVMGKKATRADITNGVTYIGKLNNGSSQQAPAGFFRSSIVRAVARVKSVRLLKPHSAKKLSR